MIQSRGLQTEHLKSFFYLFCSVKKAKESRAHVLHFMVKTNQTFRFFEKSLDKKVDFRRPNSWNKLIKKFDFRAKTVHKSSPDIVDFFVDLVKNFHHKKFRWILFHHSTISRTKWRRRRETIPRFDSFRNTFLETTFPACENRQCKVRDTRWSDRIMFNSPFTIFAYVWCLVHKRVGTSAIISNTVLSRGDRSLLDPPGNHPRGAIFPTVDQINQSSVDFYCKSFAWLIDWRKVNFDLIGLLDTYRPICFYGGGAKVTQHNGIMQYFVAWTSLPDKYPTAWRSVSSPALKKMR